MGMEKWRLLDMEYEDPFMNMAVEEAIPRMVGHGMAPCTLRFWRNPNTVVVGCFQSVNLEVDLDACARYGTQIVRRFTGGGSVYHDHGNLNYAISIPKEHRLVPSGDPMGAFKRFSGGVLHCLESLGLHSKIISFNSIEVSQKKVCGVAGSMRWGTVFYHASILISSDLDILSRILRFTDYPYTRYVKSARRTVTTISKELGRTITPKEVSEMLLKCFEKKYWIRFSRGALLGEEKRLADKLYEKYSSHQWNFKI